MAQNPRTPVWKQHVVCFGIIIAILKSMFFSQVKSQSVTRQRGFMNSVKHFLTQDRVVGSLLLFLVTSAFLLRFDKTEAMRSQETAAPEELRLESRGGPVSLSPKALCLRSGWVWFEYKSFAWCESYLGCNQAVPECPGGNENWTDIQESSRICQTTKARGYRVYCHPMVTHQGSVVETAQATHPDTL
jgi:hypothetical protein